MSEEFDELKSLSSKSFSLKHDLNNGESFRICLKVMNTNGWQITLIIACSKPNTNCKISKIPTANLSSYIYN